MPFKTGAGPAVAAAAVPARGTETRRVDRRAFGSYLIVVSFLGDGLKGRKYLIRLMLVTIAIGYAGHMLTPCSCFGGSFTLCGSGLSLCFMYNWYIGRINICGVAYFARL